LQRIISKSLSKNLEERYQTAKDLQIDLKNLLGELAFEEQLERSYSGDAATAAVRRGVSTSGMSLIQSGVAVPETKRRNRALLASVAAIVIAAVVIGAYILCFPAGDSLAVLPFSYKADEKALADPDRDYLSDGITEGIIDSLSQLPRLKVIARSSVFRYKGKSDDAQTIGRELGVRTVLTGQITQRGDT